MRTHLTRGGLSLAVTGLVAAAMTTGSTHAVAMGSMTHELAMQRTAYAALLSSSLSSSPATTVSSPVTGDLTFTLGPTTTTGVPSLVAPGYHRITEVQKGKAGRQLILVRIKSSSYSTAQLQKDSVAAMGQDDKATKALIRIVKNVESHGGTGTDPSVVSGTTHKKPPTVTFVNDLTPGTYAAVVQNSQDSKHGTITTFTVTAGKAVGAKPAVAGTFKPHEYGFDVPASVTPGSKLYAFKNSGQQAHIDVLLKVPAGTTADDVLHALTSNGPPPAGYIFDTDLSGLLTKGQTVYRKLNFQTGTYALVCFLPDQIRKGAPPHFVQGMIRVFTSS